MEFPARGKKGRLQRVLLRGAVSVVCQTSSSTKEEQNQISRKIYSIDASPRGQTYGDLRGRGRPGSAHELFRPIFSHRIPTKEQRFSVAEVFLSKRRALEIETNYWWGIPIRDPQKSSEI